MSNRLKKWVIFGLLSVLMVPVAVFAGGSLLVGPYEGEFGLLGMMGTIYRDAAQIKVTAWVLLLAPLLLGLIWAACIRLSSVMQERFSGD